MAEPTDSDVPDHERRHSRSRDRRVRIRHRFHPCNPHRKPGRAADRTARHVYANLGASLGYQIAAAIGGFAPLLAPALVGWIGRSRASLLYMSAAVVGLIAILVTMETYGRAEREHQPTGDGGEGGAGVH